MSSNKECLEPLLHPGGNGAKVAVNLSRRRTKNQADDGLSGDVDVLETAENVDFGVGKHDPGPAGVLDGELCLAVLAGDTANGTTHVLALQGLDILDLESLNVQVIQTQQGDGIVHVKAQTEGL